MSVGRGVKPLKLLLSNISHTTILDLATTSRDEIRLSMRDSNDWTGVTGTFTVKQARTLAASLTERIEEIERGN